MIDIASLELDLPLPAKEAVEALYWGILGREADPPGLAAFLGLLETGVSLRRIATMIADSPESQSRHPWDHSQFGEFGLLLRRMVARASRHAVVVDVGARGRHGSNSFNLLRDYEWRGLLIEANPHLWDAIEQEFAGLRFQLVKCGVSTTPGPAVFHLGINHDVSSLLPEAARAWGETKGEITIQTRRLGDILREYEIPDDFDLLSIDIEEMDVPVLSELFLSTAYRPHWVIFEVPKHSRSEDLADIGLSHVADLYCPVGRTLSNIILELRE